MQQIPYARAPAHNIKVKPSSRHDGLMTPSFEAVEIKKHLWNGKIFGAAIHTQIIHYIKMATNTTASH